MKNEEIIFYSIFSVMWIEFFWELYLSLRQNQVYKYAKSVPKELEKVLSKETYEKSRLYGLDKSKFGIFKDCFNMIVSAVMMWYFVIHFLWDEADAVLIRYGLPRGEMMQSAVFILLMNSLSTLISLPLSVYNTFVLEEKHGFNKQTAAFFIKDKLKAFFIIQVIMIPIICGVIWIVHAGGDLFFIYLWLFTVAMVFFFMTVYPDFIAPLFDKYTPLPEGDLRNKIEALAASVNFPLYKLYIVEGSKRSVHSNAYFYGFFKNKRIVLFDTLVKGFAPKDPDDPKADEKGCETEEILAVLAHELGHWQLNHVAKQIIIMQVNLFLQFAAFGFLLKYSDLYKAFGFPDGEEPVLIGLFVVLHCVFSPYNTVLQFFVTALSRRFEFQADKFAKSLHKAEKLGSALIKLHIDNLSFPVHDWLYSTWHHSHPTLLQRLAKLRLDKDD